MGEMKNINQIVERAITTLFISNQNSFVHQYLVPAINDAIQMYKYSIMPLYTVDSCEIFKFFGPLPEDIEVYSYVQKLLNPFDRLAEVIFQDISERNKTHDKKIYFLLTPTTIGEIFWSYYNKSNLSSDKLFKIRATLKRVLYNYDKIIELFKYIKNINIENTNELSRAFLKLKEKFSDTLTLDILIHLKEEGKVEFTDYLEDKYQQNLINKVKSAVKLINNYSCFISLNDVLESDKFFNGLVSPQDLYNEKYFIDALSRITYMHPIRFLKDESNRVDALNSMINLSLNEKSAKIKDFNWIFLIFTRSKAFDSIRLYYDFYMRKKMPFARSIARKHISILLSLCLSNKLENNNEDFEDLRRILEGIVNFERKRPFDKTSIIFHLLIGNPSLSECLKNKRKIVNEINKEIKTRDIYQDYLDKSNKEEESDLLKAYEMFQEIDYPFLPTKDELRNIVEDLLNFEKISRQLDEIRDELKDVILYNINILSKFLGNFNFLLTDEQRRFIEELKDMS